MKDAFNLRTLFPIYNETYLKEYNYIGDRIILSIFTIFFCVVGLVGNGNIIWLLGFRIRRKPFAIFILNLAVANFGYIVFLLPLHICFNPLIFKEYFPIPHVPFLLLVSLHLLMYTSCHLLLTVISMDRWVSILFPNWYRCHRSHVSSTTVCVLVWALSFGLMGVPLFLEFFGDDFMSDYYVFAFRGFILICLFLVIISTLTLFIKVCFKSQPCQCGNLLKVILFMLPSFLLLTILSEVCNLTTLLPAAFDDFWMSVKNSINPLIYFLAGRQYRGKFQERMKATLQKVFREERNARMELQPRTQTML